MRVVRGVWAFRAQFLIVTVVGALLSFVAAVGGLFVSAAGSGAVALEYERYGVAAPAVTIQSAGLTSAARVAEVDGWVQERLRAVPGLATGVRTVRPLNPMAVGVGEPTVGIELLWRDGFEEQVQPVGPTTSEDGVWLPASLAESLNVEAGGVVALGLEGVVERPAMMPVRGVYQDLTSLPPSRFWDGLASRVYGVGGEGGRPVVLAERSVVVEAALGSQPRGDLQFEWAHPLTPDALSLAEVTQTESAVAALVEEAGDSTSGLSQELRRLSQPREPQTAVTTIVPAMVERAERTVAGLAAPVRTVQAAGVGVSAGGLVVAALLLGRARVGEQRLRVAQGRSVASRWAVAATELVAPLLAAWLLGASGAHLIVSAADLGEVAPTASMAALVGAGAVALVGWGLAAAALVATDGTGSRRLPSGVRGVARRIPWGSLLTVVAVVGAWRLSRVNALVVDAAGGVEIDWLLVAVPVAALAAIAVGGVRGARLVLRMGRTAPPRWPNGLWLAARRLAAAPAPALALVGVLAASVGLLAYSATLQSSTASTVSAKLLTRSGAPVVTTVYGDVEEQLADLGSPATLVRRTQGRLVDRDITVDVLAVEPETWLQVVELDAFDVTAQDVATLAGGPGVRAVVAGGDLERGAVDRLRISSRLVDVEVGATTPAFPGSGGERGLLVVDAGRLSEAVTAAGGTRISGRAEVWADGPADLIEGRLRDTGVFVLRSAGAQELAVRTGAVELTWSLRLVGGLGVLAAGLAGTGLAGYLSMRARQQRVFAVLAERMGVSSRARAGALMIELAGLLGIGTVVGLAAGVGVGALMSGLVDPLPGLPPGPQVTVPIGELRWVVAVAAAAAVAGGWWAQRHSARTDASQALRMAQ